MLKARWSVCVTVLAVVDEIVNSAKLVTKTPLEKKGGENCLPVPPYARYNIGNSNLENLLDSEAVTNLGKCAIRDL